MNGKLTKKYGKVDPNQVFKERIEKLKLSEKDFNFWDFFNNKTVKIFLTNGEILEGTLVTNSYNKYDVLLKTSDGFYLIRKDVIMKVLTTQ